MSGNDKAVARQGCICWDSLRHPNELNMTLHISEKIEGKWAVLPKRWVVERTFSWLGSFRRLSKDFEILTATAENMIRIAMLKITLAKCV
jgi:putative transposase